MIPKRIDTEGEALVNPRNYIKCTSVLGLGPGRIRSSTSLMLTLVVMVLSPACRIKALVPAVPPYRKRALTVASE